MRKIMVICGVFLLLCNESTAMAAQHCFTNIAASTPTSNFTDNGTGTITDNSTGLMWMKCSEGLGGANCATGTAIRYTWQAAFQRAQTVNAGGGFAGFSDWRVPNLKELYSLMEVQCVYPAINTTLFPNTFFDPTIRTMVGYWTSTPIPATNKSWFVDFTRNDFVRSDIRLSTRYLRLVRGGR